MTVTTHVAPAEMLAEDVYAGFFARAATKALGTFAMTLQSSALRPPTTQTDPARVTESSGQSDGLAGRNSGPARRQQSRCCTPFQCETSS